MVALRILVALVFSQTPEESTRELEIRMTELVNGERKARRIAPLDLSPELSTVAREYSRRMAERGEIHHELDLPMEERIAAARPDICRFGENVSKHSNIDYAIGDLLLSPGHRANLLSPEFSLLGIGIVESDDGFLYITQEFARPCEKKGARGSTSRTSSPPFPAKPR